MKSIITFLLLVFAISIGFAQETESKENKTSFRAQQRALSKERISTLKDGALLVRLFTKKNSIAALKKIGKPEKAEKLEKEQAAYNQRIVSAFKANFNFCPTYFFFSDYSTAIAEKQFDKAVFLNDSLLPDTNIKFNSTKFLTAEFGYVEQDTAKYFSYYSFEPNANIDESRVKNYYGGSDASFAALVIHTDKFEQISRPFPYYVRTYRSMCSARRAKKTVRFMNQNLHSYYKKKYE
jgi:hypothetical protein